MRLVTRSAAMIKRPWPSARVERHCTWGIGVLDCLPWDQVSPPGWLSDQSSRHYAAQEQGRDWQTNDTNCGEASYAWANGRLWQVPMGAGSACVCRIFCIAFCFV